MADTNKIERPLLRMATAILDSLRQAVDGGQLARSGDKSLARYSFHSNKKRSAASR